jgi:hypothetical protein
MKIMTRNKKGIKRKKQQKINHNKATQYFLELWDLELWDFNKNKPKKKAKKRKILKKNQT